jgi:hypothetical protein
VGLNPGQGMLRASAPSSVVLPCWPLARVTDWDGLLKLTGQRAKPVKAAADYELVHYTKCITRSALNGTRNNLTGLSYNHQLLQIRPRSLFQLRTTSAMMNERLDSWEDSLDEWSARRKASAYTGQHKTERRGQTHIPWTGFETATQVFKRQKTTVTEIFLIPNWIYKH